MDDEMRIRFFGDALGHFESLTHAHVGHDGAAHLQEDGCLRLFGVVTRMICALRQSKVFSANIAGISAAAPQVV